MTSKFKVGDLVRKVKGSRWGGRVVGTYSTTLTPEGYCVESDSEHGSVQIYPASALEMVSENSTPESRGWVRSGIYWTHPDRPGETWEDPENATL